MYSEFVTYCKQKGYTCLSTENEYLKTTQPEVICPNFHIYSVRPYDFKKRGYRCVLCRFEDRYQKFEEICEKSQYTCLSPPLSFKDLKSDIFVFCGRQHLQTAKYKNVIQNGFQAVNQYCRQSPDFSIPISGSLLGLSSLILFWEHAFPNSSM